MHARRRILVWLAALLAAPRAFAQVTGHRSPVTEFAPVVPGYTLRFPEDEGSHPEFRLEWWYVTGWLEGAAHPLGFQVTFFRVRPELQHANPSAFTPHHILIAHAALSDPSRAQLVSAERVAREGFGLAGAALGRTRVWIDDWSLEQRDGRYHIELPAGTFQFSFALTATQPPLLHGENGLSRKGPADSLASYYYSLPHLALQGVLTRRGRAQTVGGVAWLDHEWSSSLMADEAVGWDWIGVNLDDGGALMAFRMRDAHGGHFFAGGTLRGADGHLRVFAPDEVRFFPRREWRSARTGTSYPVSLVVRAGDREFAIDPLFDDQEHDARVSAGTIYWEGAVRALRAGREIGRGYLELTGYWRRMNL
jgi:predicted secreted hydrolase